MTVNRQQQKALSEINNQYEKELLEQTQKEVAVEKKEGRGLRERLGQVQTESRKWNKKYVDTRTEITKLKRSIREFQTIQKQQKAKAKKEEMERGDALVQEVKSPEDIEIRNPTQFDIDALRERQVVLTRQIAESRSSYKEKRKELARLKLKLETDQKKVVIILKEKEKHWK